MPDVSCVVLRQMCPAQMPSKTTLPSSRGSWTGCLMATTTGWDLVSEVRTPTSVIRELVLCYFTPHKLNETSFPEAGITAPDVLISKITVFVLFLLKKNMSLCVKHLSDSLFMCIVTLTWFCTDKLIITRCWWPEKFRVTPDWRRGKQFQQSHLHLTIIKPCLCQC